MTVDEIRALQAERTRLADALDDIARIALASDAQSLRCHWIAERAKSALNGDGRWLQVQFPRCEVHIENHIRERGICTPG